MKYLCLVYAEEQDLDAMDDEECAAYDDSLKTTGKRIAAEALESVQTATTVRVRHGKMSIIDGPFAETKEALAGFYLVDATDLNDAIRIASRIPAARVGCVEVRPVRQLEVRSRTLAIGA
jgi:hypothetical protein